MVFYGWKRSAFDGPNDVCECKKCHAETEHQIRHLHSTFHVYFIFTVVFRTRYELRCLTCETTQEVSCSPELQQKWGVPEISFYRRYSLVGAVFAFAMIAGFSGTRLNFGGAAAQNALTAKAEASKLADQAVTPNDNDGFIIAPEGVTDGVWADLHSQLMITYEDQADRNQSIYLDLYKYKRALEQIPVGQRSAEVEQIVERVMDLRKNTQVASTGIDEGAKNSEIEGISEQDWQELRDKLTVLYRENEDRDTLVLNHLDEYKKAIEPIPAGYRQETLKRINASLDESIESRAEREKTAQQTF